MDVKQISLAALAACLLAGCVANAPVPAQPDAPVPAAPAGTGEAAKADAPAAPPTGAGKRSDAQAAGDEVLQRNLDTLANRLTLVQEQLIQIKAQGADLSVQSETALARLQMLTGTPARGGDAGADVTASPEAAPEQLASLIDQLSQIANELSLAAVGDRYRIAADYTDGGQWVLIRYDRFTGESWLADQGSWQPLLESGALESSDYEIQLSGARADKDIKGYVAARLDRRTGDSWWLKQNTWQKFD
ncbi:hypothetical protein [Marinobacterium rhizophilum]|uniref:Uncharacterized protein n=1 Tax=Marinobacterium rhizophilum TaxID=420402 RepID=A0ABY5HQU2_9GAMM|nr:hypothetical protein [Marinobacterium rhizophilum]UTW13592.1 hypothetical protein KDW95_08120 [Marinobacterium rhizophilum]